jgi:hypothetical protein
MAAFSRRWFPGREVTTKSMAEALFLEKDYWEKQQIAVTNGVARAFKGS